MRKSQKYLVMMGLAMAMAAVPMTSYGGFFKSAKTEAAEETAVKYEFKSGETVIAMGGEAEAVIKALGTPVKPVFEQDSCAYQGKDKAYVYGGFELDTHRVDGKERITSVYFLDDTVSTPEGIKIGSKKKDVTDTYGTGYDKEEEKFGTYSYTAGTAQLKIYTTGGVVDGIEYLVVSEK